jgi:lysophospholipase L1-like esterase
VETNNRPPSPGLSNNTLRQVVHVSIGGENVRLRLSNEFSGSALSIKSVHIANSVSAGTIDVATDKALTFAGKPDATIAAKGAITSDPLPFKLAARSNLAISIQFGSVPSDVTGHPGSRTTSYIQTGNAVTTANLNSATKTEHWYIISALDVEASSNSGSVAILGDSITDGRGSGTDKQNRWPDELARLLQANTQTQDVGVLNHGVGGNCVLSACLGPAGTARFEQDVLQQTGVKWFIILEGVNDLGNSGSADSVATNLITSFGQMADRAHNKGLLAYGATILPFGGSSYDNASREAARKKVNEWIRTSNKFDAVIDFDAAMRDPSNPSRLRAAVDSGDHLHPNENGYKVMAEAVDLKLFY